MATVLKPTVDVYSAITEGQKIATIPKVNDNDVAIITKSATIQSLIAMVMDLNVRVAKLEGTPVK